MNWREATARVLVEAAHAHPDDVVLVVGDDSVADALASYVRTIVRRADLRDPPPGLSVVLHHWRLRHLEPDAQRALFRELAGILPERGLVVIGDVMWSLPPDQIDDPAQYGDALTYVRTTDTIERWAREAGFLCDLHRLSPGVAVLIAVRA